MVQFIKGLDLGKDFHAEIVRPLLLTHFPTLKYSATLIGNGSEILGFDTEMSVDHDWGPRMILFIENIDHKNDIFEMLANKLLPLSNLSQPVSIFAKQTVSSYLITLTLVVGLITESKLSQLKIISSNI